MRELLMIHGRSQENKDPDLLKKSWIDALKEGLAKSGLQLPINDNQIRFPFYGDTLDQLNRGLSAEQVARVAVRGSEDNDQEAFFIRSVILEIAEENGITDEKVLQLVEGPIEKGILNWGWVQKVLETLDQNVPYASSVSVALATRDVYRYLHNPGIRAMINLGVSRAFTPNVETVVVSHSLGTVVAYNLLKEDGPENNWIIPFFVTLGSPLAVRAIKEAVAPRKHPSCVGKWFNAMDDRDVVALYPLDQHHFSIEPPIENKTDIDNESENRHSIEGYLSDPIVAKNIYEALTM